MDKLENPCRRASRFLTITTTILLDNIIIENKEILKVVDILGRETKEKENELLFYIYNDGTVEKKIIIE